jgi:hypothetical protein
MARARELTAAARNFNRRRINWRMRRIIVDAVLITGGALMLAGCGLADSHSPVPELMRAKASDPPPPEPPPDVGQLVRKDLESVFVANSYPRQVRVSPPHRDLHGSGWTACLRAEVTSAMGKPLGPQTYRVTISGGVIVDRRRVEADDTCASETYEPV